MENNGLIGKFNAKQGEMVAVIINSRSFHAEVRQARVYGKVVYATPEEVRLDVKESKQVDNSPRFKTIRLRDCASYSVNT